MGNKSDNFSWFRARLCYPGLLFIPLIVAGGKMAVQILLNLWNMLEPH